MIVLATDSFFMAMFFFIWAMNMMAFVPFAQFPVTSRIAFPAMFALIGWHPTDKRGRALLGDAPPVAEQVMPLGA